ncbi:hypothetical protein CYY_006359 [Polysphondylium violaceum]|uniref:Uncharacterized protein n=1 Tax=Polysphondylium violaceum TaxID=133409 RepID=A0A8J4PQJ5_9MYCE|nr:hypothetical protein CYY_006359 [Polysphondylium violaceum]
MAKKRKVDEEQSNPPSPLESPREVEPIQQQIEPVPLPPPKPRVKVNKRSIRVQPDQLPEGAEYVDVNVHEERSKKRETCEFYLKNPQNLMQMIKTIIFNFQTRNSLSFKDFKEIWRTQQLNPFFESLSMNPSLIHMLYYAVLGYTLVNQPVNTKAAIIYSLYIIYNCQVLKPKVPIIITINMWNSLLGYCDSFKFHPEALEPYHAFKELRKSNAFVFSALLHPISSMPIFKTNSTQVSAPVIPTELVGVDTLKDVIDFDEFQHIHELYESAKSKIVNSDETLKTSLGFAKHDFYQQIHRSFEDHALDRFTKMQENKMPGIP